MIQLQLKENQNQSWFTLSEQPTKTQWVAFTSLQLLDIYTTYKGLQYNCVKELNPILGESPSVGKMFLVKTAVLIPAINHDIKHSYVSPQLFSEMNLLMTIVIANNIDKYQEAKKYCKKR